MRVDDSLRSNYPAISLGHQGQNSVFFIYSITNLPLPPLSFNRTVRELTPTLPVRTSLMKGPLRIMCKLYLYKLGN